MILNIESKRIKKEGIALPPDYAERMQLLEEKRLAERKEKRERKLEKERKLVQILSSNNSHRHRAAKE